MTPSAAPPEVEDLARSCVEYVKRALGTELDFRPETLPLLDHYLRDVKATLEDRPELGILVARAAGAYFGEVLKQQIQGFWRSSSDNLHEFQICSSVAFLSVNPFGVAYDALYAGTDHDGPRSMLRVAGEDHAYVAQRLAAIPEVAEDEFYLLTTRIETIEIAVEALRARLEEEGYSEMEYTTDDYEAELRYVN